MYAKQISVTAMIVSLAACGGSTVEQVVEDAIVGAGAGQVVTPVIGDGTTITNPSIASAADLDLAELEELIEEFQEELEGLDITDLSTLPTSGDALSYGGVAVLAEVEFGEDEDGEFVEEFGFEDILALGDMSLSIELDTNDVSGSIDSIRFADDEALFGGSLDVAGTLNRTSDPDEDFAISGTISGTVVDPDDVSVEVATDLAADLVGSDADYVVGDGIGIADIDGDELDVMIAFGLEAED